MFSQRIKQVMQAEQLLTAAPSTTVLEACRHMARDRQSAVVVIEGGLVAGIFTERDVVQRVIAEGRDPQLTRLADVMTPRPVTVHPDKTFGHALALMHERGVRHMPVAVDGRPVGMLSARDALDPDLEEFVCEATRREAML